MLRGKRVFLVCFFWKPFQEFPFRCKPALKRKYRRVIFTSASSHTHYSTASFLSVTLSKVLKSFYFFSLSLPQFFFGIFFFFKPYIHVICMWQPAEKKLRFLSLECECVCFFFLNKFPLPFDGVCWRECM